MATAVVTGGTGFVGANLVRRLLGEGHAVHLLVRQDHDPWRIDDIRHDLKLHEVDLTDPDACASALQRTTPDWIFHLAAHGAYPSQRDTAAMIGTNLVGTLTLVRAALRVGFESFVNTGSSSEYGYKDHAPSEDELPEPNSDYAATKAAATLYCGFLARQHEAKIVTLRLYSVFGPFEEPARLIPTLIVKGLRGVLPPLVDPSTARDFVHADDVCDAYLSAATRDLPNGAVYNIGCGRQVTLGEIVQVAREELGISEEPRWDTMPGRSWDTSVWIADPARAHRDLGWEARRSLREGFRSTIAWFRSDPDLLERYERVQPSD